MRVAQLLLTNKQAPRGIRKTTISESITIGSRSLVVILLVILSITSVYYVLHNNESATKGYELVNLQQERTRLVLNNEKWDIMINREKSLDSLKRSKLVSNMVKANDSQFIRGDSAVAKLDY